MFRFTTRKTVYLFISIFFNSSLLFAQGSLTQSYIGTINTNSGMWSSICNGPSTTIEFTLPLGENVDILGIDYDYDFVSISPNSPNTQQSNLYLQNANLSDTIRGNSNGTQGATENYQGSTSFANGTYSGGTTLIFEIRAWRTFGANPGCNDLDQFISNYTLTIHYSASYDTPKIGVNTIQPDATLDVNGKIKIGNDNENTVIGNIRFNEALKDFEGYDGSKWSSFTQQRMEDPQFEKGNLNNASSYNIDDVSLVGDSVSIIYDSGGPNLNYGSNEDFSIYFNNPFPLKAHGVEFVIEVISLEAGSDFLYLDGERLSLENNSITTILQYGDPVLRFTSNIFNNQAGFKITASYVFNNDFRGTKLEEQGWSWFKVIEKDAMIGGVKDSSMITLDSIGFGSLQYGENGFAQGKKSVALGQVAKAKGEESVAIGSGAQSTGSKSIAIGTENEAIGTSAVSLGFRTLAQGSRSIAMGSETEAGGYASTAMGLGSKANGYASLAAGEMAQVTASYGVALGQGAQATSINAIAIGDDVTASSDAALALGRNSISSGVASTAMGATTEASGDFSMAINSGTIASGSASTAMGDGSTASGLYSLAGGFYSVATGAHSLAFGREATASMESAIALGQNTEASGLNSMALGPNSTASAEASLAYGFNSVASDKFSVAIGLGAIASGLSAFAIGPGVEASGNYSTALGRYSDTNAKTGAFMIGDSRNPTVTFLEKSLNDDEFKARFQFYRFYTNSDVTSTVATGVYMNPNSNSWISYSDRTKKENFEKVDGMIVLDKLNSIELTSWNYKGLDPANQRHYGIMAQDFYEAFGQDSYGTIGCDTMVNPLDLLGVAYSAIQALDDERRKLWEENLQLQENFSQLQESQAKLEEELVAIKKYIMLSNE